LRHCGDLDPPRLHRLRDLAREVDRQQPVIQPSPSYFDIVGEPEPVLERTALQPLIQELSTRFADGLADDGQQLGSLVTDSSFGLNPATTSVMR
jgi:hypothetical protein